MVQGDSQPQTFNPQLTDCMAGGQFPIERAITFYDLADMS